MADIINSIFCRKKVILPRLETYGFIREGKNYIFSKTLTGCGFNLTVSVTPSGEVSAKMIDPAVNDVYALHLVDGATGSFAGLVRREYQELLTDIADKCFKPHVFKSEQANAIIEYIRSHYGDELEYLWQKSPDNAVMRRKDTKKWYGAILTVSRRKLNLESDDTAEIIDLRYPPEKIKELVDGKFYFPGWHMNKKSWYTIILDGTVNTEELFRKIDESYILAVK